MRETFLLQYVSIFKTVCILCVVFTTFFNNHFILADYIGLKLPSNLAKESDNKIPKALNVNEG